MTCAPERANRSAMAAPMPDPAPVTSAVLPARGPMTDRGRGWLYSTLVLPGGGVPRSEQPDAALAELHTYHSTLNLGERVPADVVPALERLRGLGLRLAVISNANGTLHAVFNRLGLTSRVDAVLDSCDEGVEKPDARLFEICLVRVGRRD